MRFNPPEIRAREAWQRYLAHGTGTNQQCAAHFQLIELGAMRREDSPFCLAYWLKQEGI